MKKFYIFITILVLLLTIKASSQTAVDFTLNNCDNYSVNLYSTLDQGNVVILIYEMGCQSCLKGAQNVASVINNSYSGIDNIKVMYLDHAGHDCSTVENWVASNSLIPGSCFEYSNDYSSPYGSGMPVIVVAGGLDHEICLIANNKSDTNTIHIAIQCALENISSSSVNLIHNNNDAVRIYPIPLSSGNLFISFGVNNVMFTKADIIDITGKVLKELTLTDAVYNKNQIEVSVSDLFNGSYFIRLYTNEEVIIKKFTINK